MGEVELDLSIGRTEMPKETKATKKIEKNKIVANEEKEYVSCLRN
jgi:hypothetical protein